MATAQSSHEITSDEIELLSFLRQNIIRKLYKEAAHQGRSKTDPWVIRAVVNHFNVGLTPMGFSTIWYTRWHNLFEVSFCGSQFMSPHTWQDQLWSDLPSVEKDERSSPASLPSHENIDSSPGQR